MRRGIRKTCPKQRDFATSLCRSLRHAYENGWPTARNVRLRRLPCCGPREVVSRQVSHVHKALEFLPRRPTLSLHARHTTSCFDCLLKSLLSISSSMRCFDRRRTTPFANCPGGEAGCRRAQDNGGPLAQAANAAAARSRHPQNSPPYPSHSASPCSGAKHGTAQDDT